MNESLAVTTDRRAWLNHLGADGARHRRAVNVFHAPVLAEYDVVPRLDCHSAGGASGKIDHSEALVSLADSKRLNRTPHPSAMHGMLVGSSPSRAPPTPPSARERVEHADYLAIRRHLPGDHQDILDFAYLTGWRRGEVLGLEWRDVDRAGGVIRLRPEMSKTREGRVLVLSAPLHEVIERRWRGRAVGVPLVFHRDGRSLDHFKDVWRRACKAAGMPRKLFHDLRRTAVRNMVRAGIPERVAMQVSGHKTRSIFDRYNIVSETDLRQAADRLAAYVGGVGA